jgi:hypothetical protein
MKRFFYTQYVCFLVISLLLGADAMSQVPSYPRIITHMNDSRTDGISYEAEQASIEHHLQKTESGKKLSDFSKPGEQSVTVDLSNQAVAAGSHALLNHLSKAHINEKSSWEIKIIYDEYRNYHEHSYNQNSFGNWTLISEFLKILPNIKTLKWDVNRPIPSNIHDHLQANHPSCRLYYAMPASQAWVDEDEALFELQEQMVVPELRRRNHESSQNDPDKGEDSSLINSTILYSLTVDDVTAGHSGLSAKRTMLLISQILASSPNIKEFEISTQVPFNFTASPNLRFPPLEVLKLQNYDFDRQPDGASWIEHHRKFYSPWNYLPDPILKWIGYPLIKRMSGMHEYNRPRDMWSISPEEKTNLDPWLEIMDWSNIHTLSLNEPSPATLQKLTNKLPSLRNFALSGYYLKARHIMRPSQGSGPWQKNISHLLDFLENTSVPLESISLSNIQLESTEDLLASVVRRHGFMLRSLSLTSLSITGRTCSSPYLSPSQISYLFITCPLLSTLELDIYAKDNWDYDRFDAVLAAENLKELKLHLQPGYEGRGYMHMYDEDDDDYDNGISYGSGRGREEKSLIGGLARYLRKSKAGKKFEVLEIYVGGRRVDD